MKKTLGFVLVLCMMVPLFAFSGGTAFAAKDYSPYTDTVDVQSGDTVYSICNAKGLNYTEVRQAILIANGFADDASLGAIRPGQKLLIPKNLESAKKIVDLYNTVVKAEIPAGSVVTYKVCKGDSISSICSGMNLTLSKCKSAILILNDWSDESRLGSIYVGQEIKFPSSDAAAESMLRTISAAREMNINVSAASGDELEFYLVKHTLAKGETMRKVSNAYGVSYITVSEKLKQMNGIDDMSKVQAGTTYYFISNESNGTGYAVYSHKIVAGDTVNGLCKNYGAKYNDVAQILAGLNPKMNLSSIKTGSKIYLVSPLGDVASTPIVIR